MSRKFGLPLIFAGLLALTGGSVATQQQFPPGYVDQKPILDAEIAGSLLIILEPARTSTGRASIRSPTTPAR